jgi:hypothetical protein
MPCVDPWSHDPDHYRQILEMSPAVDPLHPTARAILGSILASPIAWCLLRRQKTHETDALRKVLKDYGLRPEVIDWWTGGLIAAGHDLDIIDMLVDWRWLARWGSHAITLTALAAERLGVHLVGIGPDDHQRCVWKPVAAPDDRPVKVGRHWGSNGDGDRQAWIEAYADSRPGPVAEAIANEGYLLEAVRQADGKLDVDEVSGKIRQQQVLIFGTPVLIDARLSKGRPSKPKPAKPKTSKARNRKGNRKQRRAPRPTPVAAEQPATPARNSFDLSTLRQELVEVG